MAGFGTNIVVLLLNINNHPLPNKSKNVTYPKSAIEKIVKTANLTMGLQSIKNLF